MSMLPDEFNHDAKPNSEQSAEKKPDASEEEQGSLSRDDLVEMLRVKIHYFNRSPPHERHAPCFGSELYDIASIILGILIADKK
jgi:hypothetical protein